VTRLLLFLFLVIIKVRSLGLGAKKCLQCKSTIVFFFKDFRVKGRGEGILHSGFKSVNLQEDC